MKPFTTVMIRLPTAFVLLLIATSFISCEPDYPLDEVCTCGGEIGGWDEPNDTTITQKKDTTGGFDVSVTQWGDTLTQDIYF